MKLLIITQKVDINDDLLGFFHGWLIEFAKHADLIIIANEVGEYQLPPCVRVFSLGKERGRGRFFRWLNYCLLFAGNLWKVDGVFFHMCPEYVVAAGIMPKIFGKKTALWYAHRHIGWKLKLAEKLVDKIFTPSAESFNLSSKKVEVTGHGIDLKKFEIRNPKSETGGNFKIIYVGRISPIKNQKLLIEAADILVNGKNINDISINFIGGTVYKEDVIYLNKLKSLVEKYRLADFVGFLGSVPYKDIVKHYEAADLSVNLCPTGGLDKAVLESMACGLPVIVFNKAFEPMIGEYKNELLLNSENGEELAGKIIGLMGRGQNHLEKLGDYLREKVAAHSNLVEVIKIIINEFRPNR